MHWAEFVLYLISGLLEAVLWCAVGQDLAAPRPGPRPLPEVEPDDWTCPDAAKIARVVSGRGPQAKERRADRFLTSPPEGPDPLWDRELDG
jgi:hypothetical protein